MLSDDAVRLIRETLAAAPRGERSRVVEDLARRFGCSPATVYRQARLNGPRRRREPQRPEYREWTRVAVAIAHRSPKPVPLDLAIEAAIGSGALPPEAAMMPVGTAHRIAREELGFRRRKMHRRMGAEWPMQAVQVDASTSERLYPVERRGDDWLLRVYDRPWKASGYKNKPLGPERQRVLNYALWDMCTGLVVSRYVVALGETAVDAMDVLCWAFAGGREPMEGVPENLWSDLGPLAKSSASVDLLGRIGIAVVTGKPYQSSRMGGVERSHRTRWSRFERALHLREEKHILLSELNDRLGEYERRENDSRPSRTLVANRVASRSDAFRALLRGRPEPIRALPENPMETMAHEVRRNVDVAGIVKWLGEQWEVEAGAAAEFAGQRVIARRPSTNDDPDSIVLEADDGTRAAAHRWRPPRYGEVRGQKPTPLEALVVDEVGVAGGVDVFRPRTAQPSNVIAMKAPVAEAEPLENPMAVDAYADLDSAMRALTALCPPLSPGQRAKVAAYLEREGLSRRAVQELAGRLTRAVGGTG
ncbi:MAG: transposase family protein [Holophagales bacterium]|nr:transposase family protein [Holophagales bacterium]MYC11859.1 transposase family protein [Holophagales bacterium]